VIVRVRARVRLHNGNVSPPFKHTQHTYILVYSFAIYYLEGFVRVDEISERIIITRVNKEEQEEYMCLDMHT